MLELCLLGTGAVMPQPKRRLAALLVRLNGRLLLIDCGEGTQVAVRESGWSMAKIDAICITHFHADHIAGLPGLLLTMGTLGRKEPVRIIGPIGLELVVSSLRVIAPELPYELRFEEIEGSEYRASFHSARLTGFALEHIALCYGFTIELSRPGRFDADGAKALGIPVVHWAALQAGNNVRINGREFTPDMVLGPVRNGIKLVYCTDTAPCDAIIEYAKGADLLICEGTYAEDDKADKANRHGHMTFAQAAALARDAGARQLLLTHFSPSIKHPEEFISIAGSIFPGAGLAQDNLHQILRFDESPISANTGTIHS